MTDNTAQPGSADAESSSPRVYVLHENPEWLPPLLAGFEAENVPVTEWLLTGGSVDLTAAPPEGIFWSRLSASSPSRGNVYAKEYARAIYTWLSAAGRTVVNGSEVLELEVSKVAQYVALGNAGFDVPQTIAVFGTADLKTRARDLSLPFITKHNQGGKGLGVRRFDTYDEFDTYVDSDEFELPVDGITLLQEYLKSAEPFITRIEFVGGKFVYAVRVDTSAGSFELCPAEACEVPGAEQGFAPAACDVPAGFAPAACDVPEPGSALSSSGGLFQLRLGFETNPLVAQLEAFLAEQNISVAGIEFIETADGRVVVYDINTNTNYNPAVESVAELSGARTVARYLGGLLSDQYAAAAV